MAVVVLTDEQKAERGWTMELTDELKAKALELVKADPDIGNARAFLTAGAVGSKRHLHELIDDDWIDDAREARGHDSARIRAAMFERAIDGVEEPIVSVKGEIVGHKMVRSDRLLEFIGRMYLPEARALQAGRHAIDVTSGGKPIEPQRGVSLGEVLRVLADAGALPDGYQVIELADDDVVDADIVDPGAARGEIPAALPVLAEPREL